MPNPRTASNLDLIGGRLCLDFTNTLSTRDPRLAREYLGSYADWIAWSRHAGMLTEAEARTLNRLARRQPRLAQAALARALALREALYRIFAAIAAGQPAKPGDLRALNAALSEALGQMRLRRLGERYEWEWSRRGAVSLDRPLWPVLRSAADLLASDDLPRVRKCERGAGCDWLFVDATKNKSRRWCSMAQCGSVMKARRYYRRKTNAARKPGSNERQRA